MQIQQQVEQLHHFLESSRKVQKDKSGTYRELIVGNYWVVCRVDEDTASIVTLIHGARILRLYQDAEKLGLWFDRLTTNGESFLIVVIAPFALSLSKGEQRLFPQPAKSLQPIYLSSCLFFTMDRRRA